MNKFVNCSLITPTYNWPDALELLLLSVQNQSIMPNEVIIADDGSGFDTKKIIDKYRNLITVPIIHIWHDDNKNQKPKIMNKAIAASSYDYIIEIDGDIIMHKNFIEDHLKNVKSGVYLYGSRVNIKEQFLKKIFERKIINFSYFDKCIKKRNRNIRIPFLMKFSKLVAARSSKLRGCNMSFWKSDFITVNGFNENLVGWGIDDSEMIERLHNAGIKGKRLKFGAIAYHIYHKEQSRNNIEINNQIEKDTKNHKLTFIEKGINQYL